jgi:RNA polymerase sigma-70 factor (ECF subfamily)
MLRVSPLGNTQTHSRATAPQAAEDSIATRQSLLVRLRNAEDQRSWREFFDTYWNLIYRVARKAGLSDAEAQDVVQETVISVARKIAGFVYDPKVCSFKTWMLRLTRWRILNRLEAHQRETARRHVLPPSDDLTRTPTIDTVPDPACEGIESSWDREWERNVLETALERTKRRVSPAQYQIYDLCVHEQKPALEVARTLEINIGRVYLARHRVGRALRAELERLKREIEAKERAAVERR